MTRSPDHRTPASHEADSTLLDSVLDSLAHLIGGSDERQHSAWPKARIEAFDGFELFDFRLAGGEDDLLAARDPGDAPIWPMDARWAFWIPDDHPSIPSTGWMFKRVRSLSPAVWRGKLGRVFPRMVEHHELFVPPTGSAVGSTAPFGLAGGRAIHAGIYNHPRMGVAITPASVHARRGSTLDVSGEQFDVSLAHGIELRREYLWSVMLGEQGSPRTRFVTDPLGVREAFRLRDIPPGRERRAALRHWVREHWRRKGRESAQDRAWVRAHLRGATEFTWSGLRCRVEPSREDVRRSAAA